MQSPKEMNTDMLEKTLRDHVSNKNIMFHIPSHLCRIDTFKMSFQNWPYFCFTQSWWHWIMHHKCWKKICETFSSLFDSQNTWWDISKDNMTIPLKIFQFNIFFLFKNYIACCIELSVEFIQSDSYVIENVTQEKNYIIYTVY